MGLVLAGVRSQWLNLSSLPDQDKQVIMDPPFDPSQRGLFGAAVTSIQQTSEVRKKKVEAIELCLLRKATPHPPRQTAPGFGAIAARRCSRSFKGTQTPGTWAANISSKCGPGPKTQKSRRDSHHWVELPIPPTGGEEEAVDLGVVVSRDRDSAVSTQRDLCSEPPQDKLAVSSCTQDTKKRRSRSWSALCDSTPLEIQIQSAHTQYSTQGDWFTLVDLQDVYFRISTYPAHRKYPIFAFKSIAYGYQTLPFRLSLALRVFNKQRERINSWM